MTQHESLFVTVIEEIRTRVVAHARARIDVREVSLGDSLVVGESLEGSEAQLLRRVVMDHAATWAAPGGYLEQAVLNASGFRIPVDSVGFHIVVTGEECLDMADVKDRLIEDGSAELIRQIDLRLDALAAEGSLDDGVAVLAPMLGKEFFFDDDDNWHVTARLDFGAATFRSPALVR